MLINNVDETIDYQLRWKYAGIPAKYWGHTLGRIPTPDAGTAAAIAQARTFVETFPSRRRVSEGERSLLGVGAAIVGPDPGRNTELMCAILTEVHMAYGATVAYISADTYLADHQEYTRLSGDKAQREQDADRFENLREQHVKLRRVSLLAIDRLGQEWHGQSGYTGKVINRLLRERYDRGLPTLVAGTTRTSEWTVYDKTFPAFAREALPEIVLAGAARVR